MRFRSCVEWPPECHAGDSGDPNVSHDEHDSHSEAVHVCEMIKKEGMGGEGKIFPVKAWVEPIEQEVGT